MVDIMKVNVCLPKYLGDINLNVTISSGQSGTRQINNNIITKIANSNQ